MALFRTIAPKINWAVFSFFTVTQNSSKPLNVVIFNHNNYFSFDNNDSEVLSNLSFVNRRDIKRVSYLYIKTWSVICYFSERYRCKRRDKQFRMDCLRTLPALKTCECCYYCYLCFSLLSVFTHVINEHVFQLKTKENVCIRIEFNSRRRPPGRHVKTLLKFIIFFGCIVLLKIKRRHLWFDWLNEKKACCTCDTLFAANFWRSMPNDVVKFAYLKFWLQRAHSSKSFILCLCMKIIRANQAKVQFGYFVQRQQIEIIAKRLP